jgi:hypothetical protein
VLRYHSRTFQLLGIEPRRSSAAVEALAQVETKIGRTLPAPVREWYELENACRLLLECSNDDPPLDITELGEPQHDANGGGPHDLLERNVLLFRWENQGVCAWAIQLDGSDDPPVVVDVDTQFTSWVQCTAAFSRHLYACAWDYSTWIKQLRNDNELLIQAQNKPLSQEALSFLTEHFEAELVTHGWPGDTQYRFVKGDQRILIWASRNQADWHLTAETESSLEGLVNSVFPLDGVVSALWSHTEKGESLLKRIQGSEQSKSNLPELSRSRWKRLIRKT